MDSWNEKKCISRETKSKARGHRTSKTTAREVHQNVSETSMDRDKGEKRQYDPENQKRKSGEMVPTQDEEATTRKQKIKEPINTERKD